MAPAGRDEVVKAATPLAVAADPRVLLPSLKVTSSPLGMAPDDGVTVAVNVTGWPTKDGVPDDVSEVVVVTAWLPFTT